MASTIPRIGDWVTFCSFQERKMLTGFVIDISYRARSCTVFVPPVDCHYEVLISDTIIEEPVLEPEDIRALIDLALDIKDEVWFQELASGISNDEWR